MLSWEGGGAVIQPQTWVGKLRLAVSMMVTWLGIWPFGDLTRYLKILLLMLFLFYFTSFAPSFKSRDIKIVFILN